MKNEISTTVGNGNNSNLTLPTIYYPNYPDNILPDKMDLDRGDGEYTIMVGVIIDRGRFEGFYEPKIGKWWVAYGEFAAGYKQTDNDEIEGWYYLS